MSADTAVWDEKKQLDELLMHMYGYHGTTHRHNQYSPNSWPELQKHFTLSRDVCLAHAKANLETICSMGFCCYAGSDGDHFHSLGNGTYEGYYSERGCVKCLETFSADQAAEIFVQTCGFFEASAADTGPKPSPKKNLNCTCS